MPSKGSSCLVHEYLIAGKLRGNAAGLIYAYVLMAGGISWKAWLVSMQQGHCVLLETTLLIVLSSPQNKHGLRAASKLVHNGQCV